MAVLGWELQFSAANGEFSRIGRKGEPSILLQAVPEAKTEVKNRAHVDVTVEDVSRAVEEVLALGGGLVKEPSLWPTDDDPWLEWAVMSDPSGNEFCVIREVRPTL
jgi:predicted enzyme related to lactoylglutathione lyase